jgi:F0F1-type ATP synthase assembly protein I
MGERYDLHLDGSNARISPRKPQGKEKRGAPLLTYIGGAGDLGLSIALPLILSVAVGIWIDTTQHTKPIATLISLGVGLIVSVMSVVKKVKEMIRS